MLHASVVRDVVHAEAASEVRHGQPNAYWFAVVQPCLAVHHLHFETGDAGGAEGGHDRVQQVERRTEHRVHTIDLPVDLAGGDE